MEFQIQEAEITDYEAIYRLNRDEMGYGYPINKTRHKLEQIMESDSDKIYVAIAEDHVVGYVHGNDYDTIYAPHMKNIMGIAVSSAYKRKGIGRALLNAVEEWAKQTGAEAVRLVSGSGRTNAHLFYRSCGYSGDKTQLNLKKEMRE